MMARQELDFELPGADTGERNATDAIQPIVPGERVGSAIIDRPFENVRHRTEILRTETEEQKYLSDSDMRWMIAGKGLTSAQGGTLPQVIGWFPDFDPINHRGGFFIDSDIVIQPLLTPETDHLESKDYSFTSGMLTGNITITSALRGYQLGNILQIRWFAGAAHSVVIGGDPLHTIDITVINGVTTILEINADLAAFEVLHPGYITHAVGGNALTTIAITTLPPGDLDYTFQGNFERELHVVSQACLAGFFTADPQNLLGDGDTLAIYYPYLVDPNTAFTGGRRQSCPANEGALPPPDQSPLIASTQLFNTRREPEKIPLGIPICKRISDYLIFIDGTIVKYDFSLGPPYTYPIFFGEHGYTVDRIMSAASTVPVTITNMWYGAVPVSGSPWTTNSAFDNIVGDLADTAAASSGADMIGKDVHPGPILPVPLGVWSVDPVWFAAAASVADYLDAMLEKLNHKASVNADEIIGRNWEVIGTWQGNFNFVANHADLRANPVAPQFDLIYRNNGVGVAGAINWETLSIYEGVIAGVTSVRMFVYGGTIDPPGLNVTPPAVGPNGDIMIIVQSSNLTAYMCKRGIASGSPAFAWSVPANWDIFWIDQAGGPNFNSVNSVNINGIGTWNFNAPVEFFDQVAFENGSNIYFPRAALPVDMSISAITEYELVSGNPARENRVFEGLHARYVKRPVTDTLVVDPGWAVVGGKRIILNSARTLSPVPLGAATLIPAVDDCRIMYLWLQNTGDFLLTKSGPLVNKTGMPGESLYRIPQAEIGGLNQNDFCLVDVVWLTQVGAGANQRKFTGLVRNGANKYMYGDVDYSDWAGPEVWNPIIPNILIRCDLLSAPPATWGLEDPATFTFHEVSMTQFGVAHKAPRFPIEVTQTALLKIDMYVRHNTGELSFGTAQFTLGPGDHRHVSPLPPATGTYDFPEKVCKQPATSIPGGLGLDHILPIYRRGYSIPVPAAGAAIFDTTDFISYPYVAETYLNPPNLDSEASLWFTWCRTVVLTDPSEAWVKVYCLGFEWDRHQTGMTFQNA